MGENPSTFGNCLRCPVETVNWDDVQAFLHKLNVEGGTYRLPSEAEWERAARGGHLSAGHAYAGSGDWAAVAWYEENSGNRTRPVGKKPANELGLFDMSGNTREWVQDCWHGSYAVRPDADGHGGGRLSAAASAAAAPGPAAERRAARRNRFWSPLLSQQQPRLPPLLGTVVE